MILLQSVIINLSNHMERNWYKKQPIAEDEEPGPVFLMTVNFNIAEL